MNKPSQCGVYAITHLATGRLYIGSTTNLKRRWKEHQALLIGKKHHNPKLQAAWNKHGEDAFAYSVLEVTENGAGALAREQFYLESLTPHYNIALDAVAPMRGRKHSPEFSQMLSRLFKGRVFTPEHLAKIVAANAGFRHSEETKAKIVAIRTGTKSSEETRKRVSAAMKGRVITPEHRAKISASLKGHSVSPEAREKMSQAQRARFPEQPKPRPIKGTRDIAQAAFIEKAKNKSPEHLEKMRQGVIRAWARRKQESAKG